MTQLDLPMSHYGVIVGGGDPGKTVEDLVARWWRDLSPLWKPNTRKAYRHQSGLVVERLGGIPLADLVLGDVLVLHAHVAAERGDAQAGLVVNLLKSILRYGRECGWCAFGWVRRIPRFDSQERSRVLSERDVVRLDAALRDVSDPHWPSPAQACRVVLWTGERVSQIRTLVRSEVNFRFGSLEVRDGKSGQPRTRPLSRMALTLLAEMPNKGTYFFPGRRSVHAPVSDASLRRYFEAACELAGLEGCTLHTCRHTAATRLASAGANAKEIGRILGHRSVQTTLRYVHTNPNRLRDLVDQAGGGEE